MASQLPCYAEAVAELGRRALTGSDVDVLNSDVAAAVLQYFRVDLSNVLELLPDGRARFAAGAGWRAGLIGHVTIEMSGASAAGHVFRTLTPVTIADIRDERRFEVSPLLREHQVIASAFVPLYGSARPLGVLGAHCVRPRAFSTEEVARLQLLANVLSVILENKSRREVQSDQRLLRAEQMMAIGQVAAGVAHELRNPLTSIKGLIQVNLRDLRQRGLPADDLGVIEQEIRRMERTLQTFLDFARPPQPDRRRLDLAAILDRVFALVTGRARKQNVSMRLTKPEAAVAVNADQDQIQQLLLNLVLNALDVLPRGGAVEVELHAPRDRFVELYVRDTGPGIAPEVLPKVFETFVSNKETGVGLGLPISRRIAEEHGGTLTAYNLPDAGACFLLRLPAI